METVTGQMIYSHFYVRVPDGPHVGLSCFRVSFKENKPNYSVNWLETSQNWLSMTEMPISVAKTKA